MRPPDPYEVARVMREKGHAVFVNERKPYNLNLVGIRALDRDANTFNDLVGVMYLVRGFWVSFWFPATTDPGTYWRENPMNIDGVAILKPGQYRGSHKIGTHKGYRALQQAKPVTVMRDNDGDAKLDEADYEDTGMFGINIHRANAARASSQVDKWSAGCQVIADPAHFNFLMDMVALAAPGWGESFTYTLIEEADLVA